MRIESVHIHGFGCLVDRRYEFPADRAVLIIEANESGKSTLAAALLAGLCGFPNRRASGDTVKASEVYRPWGTDRYALDIDIEYGGRSLRIERDFDRKSFVVRDRETNRDISAEFDSDLTAGLLHLPREDYQRVAFISGKDVHNFSSSTGIQSRLSALVEGCDGGKGAELAIALLENTGYSLGGRSIKTETAISRLTGSISEKKKLMSELDAALDSAGEDVRMLDELQANQANLSARLNQLDDEYFRSRLCEVGERICAAEANASDIAALEQELSSLECYSNFPAERSGQLSSAIARVNERAVHLAQLRSDREQLNRYADDLRSRLSGSEQFALSSDSDVVKIGSLESELANARSAVEKLAALIMAGTSGASSILGRVLVGLGGLCGIASIALMIAHILSLTASAIAVLVGAVVGAVGLVQIARSRSFDSDARARLAQAEEFADSASRRAVDYLSGLGIQIGSDADVGAASGRTRDALSRYLVDRSKLREVEGDLAAGAREEADRERSIAEEKLVIASILKDAGIDALLSHDEAVRRFTEAEANYRRYRQVRDTLLPAFRRNASSLESIASLKEEQVELTGQVVDEEARDCTASPSQVDAERQSVRRELGETIERVRGLERKVGACVDTYRRDYPVLQEELSGLDVELDRVSRLAAALRVAGEVMREVSEGVHRRWAVALNEQAFVILPHLNPEYDTLLFDDALDFTLRRVCDGRIVNKTDVDARLSTGAKDQVYLTVRLACCKELSRLGESIPIILDDPLIAADDIRFKRGFEYLSGVLARDHQVIILSCHKSRHDDLRTETWFAAQVSTIEL